MNSTTSPHERAPLLPPTKFLHRRYSRPEPGEWHDSPVRTSIHNLRTYITVSITPATDRTLITPRDSSVITDQFIEDACAVCEDRNSLPYCALRCMEKFQRQSELYPQWSDVFDVRALAAELLARRFVSKYNSRTDLFTEVLLKKREKRFGRLKDALELAVDLHATIFLSDPEVTKCVEALWNGAIMPDDDGRIVYTVDEGDGDLRERAFINADRLVVPKYQNIINIILSLFFLVLYSVVVNQARTAAPGLLEWFVYIVVAGNVVDELQQIWKGGLFYFYSLWNCLSFLIYLIFTGAFALRIVALMTLDSEHRQQLNNTAFDVLSTLAIFLWMRVLSILDSWRYFGSYAIILQSMFKDGIIFFFLLIWVLLGFSQAFLALRSDLQHDDFKKIVGLLIQGYLSSPDFELAADFHPILGHILYVMFIFISVVILQSLLFSLFATSFQNVIDKSQAEYLTSFTFKTLSLLEAGYDLPSPFNLIGLVLLTPLRLFFSHRTYRHARRRFITITFLPVLLFIAWYERGPGRRALAQLRFDSQGETAEEEDMPLHPTTRDLEAIERILGHRFASKDAAGLEDGDVSGKSGTSGGEASKAHGETLERRLAIGKMMDMLAAIERKMESFDRKN